MRISTCVIKQKKNVVLSSLAFLDWKLHCTCSHNVCLIILQYRAVKLMILHNPESIKVTNDYLYNIIHIASLYDHRDIIPVAVEVGRTVD